MSQLDLSFASADASLSVRSISVREALSSLFEVSVLARSEDPSLNLETFVGRGANLRAQSGTTGGATRTWQGICSFAEQVHGMEVIEGAKPLTTYQFRIVPTLWLLTQRQGNRIYQHLAIPDIVDKLLAEWNVAPVWRVDRGVYPKLEYKAQYNETDYNFFCRLLEEAGIAFLFPDEEESGVKVTLSDKPQGAAAGRTILYVDNASQSTQLDMETDYVTRIRLHHEVRPGAHTLRDYDFRNPAFSLLGDAAKAPDPEGKLETYHYDPGSMLIEGGKGGSTPAADDKGVARYEQKYGADLAQRTLDADRTGKRGVSFDTDAIDLAPGVVFGVDHHPHPELAEKLLVTSLSVEHSLNHSWTLKATAVFAKDPYRPARRTEKPATKGVQSAMVVGPKGQEIHTDEFGRVRVQFPWDREGKADDNSSCWIRVSQGWAGTGFGMINLPRIGQEVLVGFLDGDPDQPIVVGRVFNAIQQVPYKLPDNKTVSGWKTSSSPGGGGYNEIKLEDKKDLELVYIQAQRNLDQLVKNDETVRTNRNQQATVVGTQDLVVKQNKKELLEQNSHLHVKGELREKIDASVSLTVGQNQDAKIGQVLTIEAGTEIHLKAGSKVVIEAGAELTLKGPGGFIDINGGGVDIVGTIVNINSGGSAGSGTAASPKAPDDAAEAHPTDTSS